jgi:hypothetical protein
VTPPGLSVPLSREDEHAQNLRDLELIRTDPAWALSRVQEARRLEARLEEAERLTESLQNEADAYADEIARLRKAERRVAGLREALTAFCDYVEAARHPWPALTQLARSGRQALAASEAEETRHGPIDLLEEAKRPTIKPGRLLDAKPVAALEAEEAKP